MITLTSGTKTLELPEASFGVVYNRYNDIVILKMVEHYVESTILKNRNTIFTVRKNIDAGIRRIKLSYIPIASLTTLKEFLHIGRYDLASTPIVITHGSNIWTGSFINNQVNFTIDKQTTFSISLEFVGKRTAGVL